MPQARTAKSTDTTGDAQSRFVVALPGELRDMIAALGDDATANVRQTTGIDITLSPAQVVQGIVKAQHALLVERVAAASNNDAAAGGES